MKVQKLIMLDYELVQRLKKEDNASALINSLVMAHYKDNRSEDQIIKDTKELMKENKRRAEWQKKSDKLSKEFKDDYKKQNK